MEGETANMGLDSTVFELRDPQFDRICALLYRSCGIKLQRSQRGFVRNRLARRLESLRLGSFQEYLAYLERDLSGHELATMVDALTTNNTSFFREPQHFEYLSREVLPRLRAEKRRLRIWSAGCSSGEEPFSIAIQLREELPDIDRRDVRILATDISTEMVTRARMAVYTDRAVRTVPPHLLRRYFTRVYVDGTDAYRVKDSVRAMVRLARLNLLENWPMKGPFEVIFCRNVMIYFDHVAQERLVQRLWRYLAAGGLLFVGHSESLAGIAHRFRYVQPAVYAK